MMKSEARSTKSETNSNDRNSKFKTVRFGDLNFDIVSNFDIRISDLPKLCVHVGQSFGHSYFSPGLFFWHGNWRSAAGRR